MSDGQLRSNSLETASKDKAEMFGHVRRKDSGHTGRSVFGWSCQAGVKEEDLRRRKLMDVLLEDMLRVVDRSLW